MKKLLLIFCLLGICITGQAQSELFQKYHDVKGVSTVQVSKAMFKLMPNLTVGNKNIKKLANKMDHLQVLTCDRQSLIETIVDEAKRIYTKKPWEEVMRYREGDENTVFYMKSRGGGKYEYAILNSEKGSFNLINIVGKVTLEELQQLTKDD